MTQKMTKREWTIAAVWLAIDPSAEGIAREAAEDAKQAIQGLPTGTFADETEVKG